MVRADWQANRNLVVRGGRMPKAVNLHNPEAVVVESERLSGGWIDALAETQQDWISCLPLDWEVNLSRSSLSHADRQPPRLLLKIWDLVDCCPAQAQTLIVDQPIGWVYTCCADISSLGRVRLVIGFGAGRGAEPIVLATNRLDWSPRKICQLFHQAGPTADQTSDQTSIYPKTAGSALTTRSIVSV